MHSSIRTKTTLSDFARIIGIHPLHFAGISYIPEGRSSPLCSNVFFQYAWQNADAVARDDIASALFEAESMIEAHVGYRLAPSWEVDEFVTMTPRHSMVRLGKGYFIAPGVEARELLGAGRPITWVDNDGDGYKEIGIATATVPLDIDPCEIEVYYPAKDGDPRFQIRPVVSIDVAGTNATIKFLRHLCVLEDTQESFNPRPVQATDDNEFLQEVDVYRHYNDPSDQGRLLWEPRMTCDCGVSGSCPSCSYATQPLCMFLHSEPRQSIVHGSPAQWDYDRGTMVPLERVTGGPPSHMRVNYYAGWQDLSLPCPRRDMDEQWKRAVVRLACSILDRPPCSCAVAEWEMWRKEVVLNPGDDQIAGSVQDRNSPFGTLYGAVYAWRRVREGNRQLGYAAVV